MGRKRVLALVGVWPALLMAGCMVNHHSNGDGKDDDVSIHTPLGGLDVKHDASAESLGLPVYPGSSAIKDGDGGGAANVSMGFGDFQLRVVALKYRTSDTEAKVEAFYRGPLGHYGRVIACRDGQAVGQPTTTAEGLDCAKEGGHSTLNNIHIGEDHDLELRTGSERHQHIVAMKQTGTGTEMTLVRLDLPRGLDSSKNEQ